MRDVLIAELTEQHLAHRRTMRGQMVTNIAHQRQVLLRMSFHQIDHLSAVQNSGMGGFTEFFAQKSGQ